MPYMPDFQPMWEEYKRKMLEIQTPRERRAYIDSLEQQGVPINIIYGLEQGINETPIAPQRPRIDYSELRSQMNSNMPVNNMPDQRTRQEAAAAMPGAAVGIPGMGNMPGGSYINFDGTPAADPRPRADTGYATPTQQYQQQMQQMRDAMGVAQQYPQQARVDMSDPLQKMRQLQQQYQVPQQSAEQRQAQMEMMRGSQMAGSIYGDLGATAGSANMGNAGPAQNSYQNQTNALQNAMIRKRRNKYSW